MYGLLYDVRIAARALLRRPRFAIVATLTIALAVGGVTAIFTLIKGTLLDALPYEESDRLVTLDVVSRQGFYISTSIPNYESWRDSDEFDRFAAAAGWSMTLTGDGPAEVLNAQAVVGDLWGTLGVTAHQGRLFGPEETDLGAAATVVLGHGFWVDRFGEDPRVVGESILLDGRPHTILGVLPQGWSYPFPGSQAYVAMGSIPGLPWADRESSFGTRIVARLAGAATAGSALQDLTRINDGVTEQVGLENASVEIRTLSQMMVGDFRTALWILFGAVGFVLLIATANVANLTLARGEGRKQEVAVRTALGAGRGTIVRGLMIESLMLSLVGGALGVLIAVGALRALGPLLPQTMATTGDRLALDASVLAFTFLVAAASGLLFGAFPALRASRPDLSDDLKDGSRTSTSGNRRLRGALVVAEVALSMVLLVGAGLMIRSLHELRTVDKGFAAESLLTARVPIDNNRYATEDAWRGFYEDLERRAIALPGADQAAVTLLLPLANRSWERRIWPEGEPVTQETGDSVLFGVVSESFFETMGVPLLMGRAFSSSDRINSPRVAVIDETMAERYWPGEDPIGKRVVLEFDDGAPVYRTVIGVAQNVRHYELETPSRIQVYLPYQQSTQTGMDMSIVVRTTVPPGQLAGPLREAVASMDPDAPLSSVTTMQDYVDRAMQGDAILGGILAAFSGLAMLLAGIGIFGVLSYTVAQRTSEIGIRMALGANASTVRRWIAMEGVALAGVGIVIGVVAALALTQLLRGFLYAVSPVDPVVYGGLALFLLGITAAATYFPAVGATRVDPATVLRSNQ